MSNSPLISCTRISPNKTSPRNHVIDTITIHCVVGQFTASQIINMGHFTTYNPKNGSSCNYAVGKDGSIGLCVDEKDRSWCSSSKSNDNRAITIEVASDTTHPYAITDAALRALINLCADICKRNNIKELKWKADKSLIGQVSKQNITVHRWFANKACPGDYIYSRLGTIAAEVNAILNSGVQSSSPAQTTNLYKVQVGAFSKKENADLMLQKVKSAGYDTYMVEVDGLYKVQVGAFSNKSNAETTLLRLKNADFEAYITGGPAVNTKSIDEIAKEVLQGKWGNGAARQAAITNAGYDYAAVQKRVNELL